MCFLAGRGLTLGKREKKKPVFTQPCDRCLLVVPSGSTVGSTPAHLPERRLQCSLAAGWEAKALGTNLLKSLALRSPGFTVVVRVTQAGVPWNSPNTPPNVTGLLRPPCRPQACRMEYERKLSGPPSHSEGSWGLWAWALMSCPRVHNASNSRNSGP